MKDIILKTKKEIKRRLESELTTINLPIQREYEVRSYLYYLDEEIRELEHQTANAGQGIPIFLGDPK